MESNKEEWGQYYLLCGWFHVNEGTQFSYKEKIPTTALKSTH
jgi:hypothetical protein